MEKEIAFSKHNDKAEEEIENLKYTKLSKKDFSIDEIIDWRNIRDVLLKRIEKGRIKYIFPKIEKREEREEMAKILMYLKYFLLWK